MIKYIGLKRIFVSRILDVVKRFKNTKTVMEIEQKVSALK